MRGQSSRDEVWSGAINPASLRALSPSPPSLASTTRSWFTPQGKRSKGGCVSSHPTAREGGDLCQRRLGKNSQGTAGGMEVGTQQSQTWENPSPSPVPLQNVSMCNSSFFHLLSPRWWRGAERHICLETNLIAGAVQHKLIFTLQDSLSLVLADYAPGLLQNLCPKPSPRSDCPLVLVWCGDKNRRKLERSDLLI